MPDHKLSGLISEDHLTFSHKLLLEPPYQLTVISHRLCETLGYSEEEIKTLFDNNYIKMVHPEDQSRYQKYLESISCCEQTLSLQYRMIRKDGNIVYLSDIMFSHKKQDEKMYGFAVIVDITEDLHFQPFYQLSPFSSSAVPFGFLQCTCEKYPKVLCINDNMLNFLGASEDNSDWQDFIHENIYFMIPFEDRDVFRRYLHQALEKPEPIKIHHRIITHSGERVPVTGWLGTIINQQGKQEYSIVYTDLDSKDMPAVSSDNSYFRALESAYNIIFELNLITGTVECIYGKNTSDLGKIYDVHMTLESARHFWLDNYIIPPDRKHMAEYFDLIKTPGVVLNSETPMQTEFRIAWDDNEVYYFIGVAIPLDSNSLLFCCRDTARLEYSGQQAREIRAMSRLHSYLDLQFESDKNSSGAIIFEKEDDNDLCTLIYADKKVREILNIPKYQYLDFMEVGLPFSFLKERAEALGLRNLEKIFDGEILRYYDQNSLEEMSISCARRIKNYYVIQIQNNALPHSATIPKTGIFARTFGFFDLFVNGTPVRFSNAKEKELFALLIDRNGGSLSSTDAIADLWEDSLPDEKTRGRFRKLALGLKKTLQNYGIEHILISKNGIRSLDTSAITCDYYEMLAGNDQYISTFHNRYMVEYSWSERTLGTLWNYSK